MAPRPVACAGEALNNIAAANRPVVIVVNDNGRSCHPTIGGLADHLATLRLRSRATRSCWRRAGISSAAFRWSASSATTACTASRRDSKDALSPQAMFTDLGLKYVGPIDGHDEHAVESALQRAGLQRPGDRARGHPQGHGLRSAEADGDEQMHASGVIDPAAGLATSEAALGWTTVFSDELIRIAASAANVVGITAAMPGPTGLAEFGKRFPDRVFDVGIAEQLHARPRPRAWPWVDCAPGGGHLLDLPQPGLRQVMMDVALHRLPVTIVLDRARRHQPRRRQP